MMKRMLRYAAAALLVAGLTSAASAALLVDLLAPGATLQQGDKIFGNFTWGGPTGPDGFTIAGIGDGTANNLFGIAIGGPLSQIGAGSKDWQLGYSVTVAPGSGMLISDIHQYVNLSGSAGSSAVISEDVLNAQGGLVVAHSTVGKVFTTLDQNDPPAELFDTLVLNIPLQTVWVKKDILLDAPTANDYITTTIIEQRFSQVPEPGTMIAGALLLLPFGASALRIFRSRKA